MINRSTHIISSVGWNTSFSEKKKAVDLQDRLSRWSRWQMPAELQTVLDALCPADQIWQIDQLQLDLGTIDYNNLERELRVNITKALTEALNGMLYKQQFEQQPTCKIESTEAAGLQTLGFFLLNGFMPWNHSNENNNYNKLFSRMLTQHTHATVALVRIAGKDRENVRKRIAWQTHEPVLHELVKGLEPVHHDEILNFTSEVVTLQQKENLVTAAQPEFRKNIWHWIMNYLLQDKDTIFNSLSFVRNTLKQMADHYNVDYQKLLSIISRALEAVQKKTHLKTDLGRTLALLTRQTVSTNDARLQNMPDYWERFEVLLQEDGSRNLVQYPQEFNELFTILAGKNPSRFMTLLYSLGYNTEKWKIIVPVLSPEALSVLFNMVNPAKGGQWLAILRWMAAAFSFPVSSQDGYDLRVTGIKFLLRHQQSSQTDEAFADYCVEETSRKKGLKKKDAYQLLIASSLKAETVSIHELSVYYAIRQHYFNSISKKENNSSADKINILMQKLAAYSMGAAAATYRDLPDELRTSLLADPETFLETIICHPEKKMLIKKLLPLISRQELAAMIYRSSHRHARLIQTTTGLICQAFTNSMDMVDWMHRYLPNHALKIVLEQPSILPAALTRRLLRFILSQQTFFGERKMIELFAAAAEEKNTSRELRTILTGVLNREQTTVTRTDQLRRWMKAYHKKNISGQLIALRLKRRMSKVLLREIASMPVFETNAWMDKLLPGSSALMQQLITAYEKQLSDKGLKDTLPRQRFNEIYWRVLFETVIAEKDSKYMQQQMDKVVMLLFPGAKKEERKQTVMQKTGTAINLIPGDKNEAALPSLLQSLLHDDTDTLVGTIRQGTRAAALLSSLKAALPLDEFLWWTTGSVSHSQAQLLRELLLLVRVTEQLFPHAKLPTEKRGWALAIQIVKGNIRTAESLKKIAHNIMQPLFLATMPSVEEVASSLQAFHFSSESPVKSAFRQLMPDLAGKLNRISQAEPDTLIRRISERGLLSELINELIGKGQLPGWFYPEKELPVHQLTTMLISHYPVLVLQALRKQPLHEKIYLHFTTVMPFSAFVNALQQAWPQQSAELKVINRVYDVLGNMKVNGIPAGALRDTLYRLLIKWFRKDLRRNITPQILLNELICELTTVYNTDPSSVIQSLKQQSRLLPPSVHMTISVLQEERATEQDQPASRSPLKPVAKQIPVAKKRKSGFETGGEKIAVKNAGLVLINMYLPILFRRLELLTDEKFNSPDHQQRAVHYLQYLSAAQHNAPEEFLVLNKILCGLPLDTPVIEEVTITTQEKEMMDGLINAVIEYWPAIGKTSIDGFRGNWLVRDGLVYETEENWCLTVEKRTYDILLGKSPFSFSVIRYPWMVKPLKTEWPF